MYICLQCNPHAIPHAVIEDAWRRPYWSCMSLWPAIQIIMYYFHPISVKHQMTTPPHFYGSDIHLQRRWRPTIVCQKNISTLKESHSITTGQTKPGLATLQPATACRHGNVNRINLNHGCKLAQLYTKHWGKMDK